MSIENPFNKPPEEKKEDEPIKGDNFVMGGKGRTPSRNSFSSHDTSVEFRPGETNEGKIKAKEEATKKELERTKDFTDADHAEDLLSSMLESNNPYSETFKIKPDGKFDKILRADGYPVYLGFGDTSAELYQIAAEIEKKHPEYHFSFETDPEGKWFKYTVSKSESGK
ncbi:MAG: hypothetical protein COZ49_00530 [Candidatus Yonathbacteria bacterium CG_4_10_14_3_um_filter_47_65]|uniref:Uncharacterized protein n=1 Tax=Candidatus Yonathbacteria bacterium CG_4_9_14_0_8_um_filter_46_47 TaxID=1975106 RepID=A0A2M8D9A6_9BACT|nr:MAG: hypothetical protein COX54_02670 [Candidatus Yonathbacteria bacterium CG23_combo_of_CG06-09_8_20_14_all_46_18]PIQ32654.1 MAG: hypothetical protein COW61_01175 [Candidatus Yonathbacteria bacterium CG17_big_fil_post_rev_8_21_14_2_50_46_19]PIX56735.1 MAG: hypothetical protein COZ49_00530 [Candidatus Yonathbacteria bacterium CG_4_10_14_3_um_filter_47_65]PJB83750.1 MAG: hypothetical protein CO088_00935 [Candidatus Yonathbacteria bacterium CG_4_9_14_0_8_um_filter_46_47]PJC21192.1 MAG: hypothe